LIIDEFKMANALVSPAGLFEKTKPIFSFSVRRSEFSVKLRKSLFEKTKPISKQAE